MTTLTALRFDVTCRRCGGELTIVNPGNHNPSEARVIVGCEPCRRDWLVLVHLEPVAKAD